MLGAAILSGIADPQPAAAAFRTLNPGGPARLTETVPVQVVMLGYERDLVPEQTILGGLPLQHKPQIIQRRFFGQPEEIGLGYGYEHRMVYADQAYEDAFFAELTRLSRPFSEVNVNRREVTCHQTAYNEQQRNVIDIPTAYALDATAVERWLVEHPPPGIDPERNTVVFVNWWGRSDFRFHIYTKLGEPDVDTGSENGRYCPQMTIAWGGTGPHDEETGFGRPSRLWFHDLSAGPDKRTGNYNVDDADIDGDGVADFRLPPVWEYLTPGGARAPSELAGDLKKVARYVAVDALFTASPVYPPALTPDAIPEDIELDMHVYEGLPGVNAARDHLEPGLIRQEVSELLSVPVKATVQAEKYEGESRRCYHLMVREANCHPERPRDVYGSRGEANLFLKHALSLGSWRDGSAEYEAGMFAYATTERFAYQGWLGFSDDNWQDGTQSGNFLIVEPLDLQNGFGPSMSAVHEYGHHFGLLHPFNSYDYEENRFYGPRGPRFFMWVGSQVNSVMSYQKNNYDFSQFDLDNSRRFRAAAYLQAANRIAGHVVTSPNASAGTAQLAEADGHFSEAQRALSAHNYQELFDKARAGYQSVRAAASAAAVPVPRSDTGWNVLPANHGGGPTHKKEYDPSVIDRGPVWRLEPTE